jgi:Mrp family chromosome partitioning ATPase
MSNPNTSEVPVQTESGESFGNILSQFERSHTTKKTEGLREGTVVSISSDSVFVDLGFKTEGVLPLSEFPNDQQSVKAGDKLQAAMQDGLKVLAITGSRRGEGRSTLALCLARAAAQAGIQAAVMDADFARPQLASKVGLEIAHGWQEAALGNIPLSEAAVKSVADQITLLPLESSAATRALSLSDPRVTATIRAAAATFELLILDLGPQGSGAQVAFPPGEGCPLDAAIVVRDLRFATAAESEAIGHSLQDAGVEAVGIAENFVIEDEERSRNDH